MRAYFLRRRTMARAVMPTIMPAMIDSHGKPGIGGNVIGVERELVLDSEVDSEVDVVVGVLMTVLVTTDVLVAVWDELVELVDELMMELVVEEVLLLTIEVEVVATVEVDVEGGGGGGGPPPGGSRWRITAKFVKGAEYTLLPTAKPFVPDRRKRDVSVALVPAGK